MAGSGRTIYVCAKCLKVSPVADTCHGELMAECDCGSPGDERSRPIMTAEGRLVTRAPRWWVDANCARAK